MGCILALWLLLLCAGATLGGTQGPPLGEKEIVAERELGLPSFKTSLGTPVVEAEVETPGGGASVRKREAET